ncbi:MAG: PadR family transcriptional regulator [Alphaproteobacteria bacterium]|nr:MAG: PadR family transcriptional regulator [Alphaproteobacteria bacterium]
MKNFFMHKCGGRRYHRSDDMSDHHSSHRRRHRRGGRLFDYGELRLLLLSMIAEQPRHGYELIKLIEERFGGSYSPSPGVIYPTLSWLDDMGYALIGEEKSSGRKSYRITEEGEAFLTANRAAADALFSRTGRGPGRMPSPVLRAMENLKVAMRLRLKEGEISKGAATDIAAAIDAAAQVIEKSK